MKQHPILSFSIAGACAGAVNGLFGAGGGMILVPLLSSITDLEDTQIFPSSIAIIAPLCVISLLVASFTTGIPVSDALPYLAGSALGGVMAGKYGNKIPVLCLHKGLGILILWGGIRYLC